MATEARTDASLALDPAASVGLDALNAHLAGLNYPFKVTLAHRSQIDLLDAGENARFMKSEVFNRLMANIQRDGGLSSVPFCWLKPDGRYLVLSGNHRIEAAWKAGQAWCLILFSDRDMSRDEQLAIQLSHNALTGEDDPTILRKLFDSIEKVELRMASGLDDKTLRTLSEVTLPPLSEARLDYRALTLMFLPEEITDMQALFERARPFLGGKTLLLARMAEYERYLTAMQQIAKSYDVKNTATQLLVMLTLFERHLTDLQEGWVDEAADTVRHKGWVPIASLFGTDTMPGEAALVVKRVIDKLVGGGRRAIGSALAGVGVPGGGVPGGSLDG